MQRPTKSPAATATVVPSLEVANCSVRASECPLSKQSYGTIRQGEPLRRCALTANDRRGALSGSPLSCVKGSQVGCLLTRTPGENDAWGRHLAHHYLADCALIAEEYDVAEERYLRSLQAAIDLGDRSEIAVELQGVAMAAAGRSRPVRALRLAGAAAAELDVLGVDMSGVRFWSALLDTNLGRARKELGSTEAGAAWEEGRLMRSEEAVRYALDSARD